MGLRQTLAELEPDDDWRPMQQQRLQPQQQQQQQQQQRQHGLCEHCGRIDQMVISFVDDHGGLLLCRRCLPQYQAELEQQEQQQQQQQQLRSSGKA